MNIVSLLFLVASASAQSWAIENVFEPGTSMPAATELDKCVTEAMKLLKIDGNMYADPALLADILKNDMHLADMPEVQKLRLIKRQPLGPMLNKIRQGITTAHPALGVTLCNALVDTNLRETLFSPNSTLITRSIHHMHLLDSVVVELVKSKSLMVSMQEYMKETVKSMTPHKSSIGHMYDIFRAAGIFGVAKDITVNWAMEGYDKLRQQEEAVSEDEIDSRRRSLTTNILEATVTDFTSGYFSNARVGHKLAWKHPDDIRVVGEEKAVQYVVNTDWARLYETWNFAFIAANLDFPNLLFPKLLIPSVLLADSNDYMFSRVLALWLSIDFFLMSDLAGKTHVKLPGGKELGTLWGNINLKYSNYVSI